jgi:hypothetical protein
LNRSLEDLMLNSKRSISALWVIAAAWVNLGMTPAADAYVDMAPTLSKIISDSKAIALVEVAQFDRAKHMITFKGVRNLKGEISTDPILHDVAAAEGGTIPRQILQWAGPGARAVLFVSRNTALVCVGQGWYQAKASEGGPWRQGINRPDLPLAYYGSLSRLSDGIELMLAGKDAVITVVPHRTNDAASFDLALNRYSLPGLIQPQRIRANLKMPAVVMAVSSNDAYLVGEGAVSEEDIPALIQRLKSPDATVRTEAACDLRTLGRKAKASADSLAGLLDDAIPGVRLAAASAVLVVSGAHAKAVDVLAKGLASEDPAVRRDAAVACGMDGPSVAPLVERLTVLLKDPDEGVRVASLQAIAMLGPIAAKAAPSVVPLLDDPQLAIDAADALGRIGPAARPVPNPLVKMLSSDQTAVQWAAVRAMSQIGGPEAHPAVEFIIQKMPNAAEVDGYNMMIYLALLGPVASDALPTVQRAPIKNPMLPSATRWAIESDKSLPWQATGGGRGGFGGFGMPPMGGRGGGPGGGFDVGRSIYEALIHELGGRLRPTAEMLARKIMDGTAGEVPEWGYQILTCASEESVQILVPYLADANMVMRERATVALGYMGPSAAKALDKVHEALSKVASEREGRLMKWCLQNISN